MSYRQRKSPLSKEQWKVQQERFHLNGDHPIPTEDHTTSIKEPLGKLVKSLGINLESTQHNLMEHWETITGPMLCRHIRPGPLENGGLTVYCTSSVMLAELSRFQGKTLLANIQKQVGVKEVRKLYFQIDPDTRGGRR